MQKRDSIGSKEACENDAAWPTQICAIELERLTLEDHSAGLGQVQTEDRQTEVIVIEAPCMEAERSGSGLDSMEKKEAKRDRILKTRAELLTAQDQPQEDAKSLQDFEAASTMQRDQTSEAPQTDEKTRQRMGTAKLTGFWTSGDRALHLVHESNGVILCLERGPTTYWFSFGSVSAEGTEMVLCRQEFLRLSGRIPMWHAVTSAATATIHRIVSADEICEVSGREERTTTWTRGHGNPLRQRLITDLHNVLHSLAGTAQASGNGLRGTWSGIWKRNDTRGGVYEDLIFAFHDVKAHVLMTFQTPCQPNSRKQSRRKYPSCFFGVRSLSPYTCSLTRTRGFLQISSPIDSDQPCITAYVAGDEHPLQGLHCIQRFQYIDVDEKQAMGSQLPPFPWALFEPFPQSISTKSWIEAVYFGDAKRLTTLVENDHGGIDHAGYACGKFANDQLRRLTPLQLACYLGYDELVRLFLRYRPNVFLLVSAQPVRKELEGQSCRDLLQQSLQHKPQVLRELKSLFLLEEAKTMSDQ